MNFINNNNNEYNVLRSSCTIVSNEDNDGIYSDETESMINHARSSPMNDSIDTIANTIRITPPSSSSTAITPTTTPPLTSKSNTDNDDDDDDHSERHVNHNNDTNSHTTIDEDLMTSYEASIDIEYNNNHYELHNELMHKSLPINSLNSMKKPEKQVTFQDIVEISTIYSITNESQESISHHYENGDDDNDDDEEEDDYNDDDDDDDDDEEEEEEMEMTKQNSVNKKLKNRLKNVIKSNDHNVGLVIATIEQNNKNNSDNNNNQILSEKDLLSVSDRLELFYFF
ncbi:hypothetical protein MS3_00009025 [Schistosoma haematobium]|uniref:Uncharacterized protein n=1 Tax=Schistosoma haematobium TaxID=6185 RepID=A0A922IJP4_SCHHA|nr:hypothetical protein MS3_00009025 [Schistosoma haematobium]KAH9580343.1 hypothetical protein MS3_00009025 [Schistosoma haematobium]